MLKRIFHLSNHGEILCKSSWRLCLSLSEIIMFFFYFHPVFNFAMKLFSPILMSFMYIMNITSPRTEPYRTPLVTGAQSEGISLITTFFFNCLASF